MPLANITRAAPRSHPHNLAGQFLSAPSCPGLIWVARPPSDGLVHRFSKTPDWASRRQAEAAMIRLLLPTDDWERPDYQTTDYRLPDYQTARLPDCQTTGLPDDQTTRLPDYQTTRLPLVTKIPDYQTTRLLTINVPFYHILRLGGRKLLAWGPGVQKPNCIDLHQGLGVQMGNKMRSRSPLGSYLSADPNLHSPGANVTEGTWYGTQL
ncbi:hypothetical protein CCM_01122 [Cordyceps militaris CM01]|uniref:Uncharacterized protein n=1 Tax=Cordyceps militaris (strain CM01) TaxID=983644 RepID=G3J384_CORMM|nr:uncharacterized protein CCM_01122 [Cordyceps militaris CM01]EGX96465.1 hypothetical protein CCM_01122 [Cordyceps militaris CM01]